MVEFAAGALAALAGGIGEGAAAIGTAASGLSLSGLATTGSLFAGILGGAASLTSAMATQRAAEAKSQALYAQADDATADARQTDIAATQRQTSLKRDLLASLGQRDVAYAASGVDLSFGTPAVARQEAVTDADRALATDRANSDATKARLMQRAAQYRLAAGQTLDAGDYAAGGDVLSAGYRLLRRG